MGVHFELIHTEEGPTQYKCKHCDLQTEGPKGRGDMLRHHNPKDPNRCPNRDWEAEAEVTEIEASERLDTAGMTDREIVAMYGLIGLEQLLRGRLTEYLESAPKVSKKVVKWIVKQWDADEAVRKDPNMLYSILTESGVEARVAWRITNAINSLLQSFQPLVQAPTAPFRGIQTQSTPPFNPWQQPTQYGYVPPGLPSTAGYPPTYAPPGFVSQDQVARMRSDWMKEAKLEKMEDKIGDVSKELTEEMKNLKKELVSKLDAAATPEGQYEEVKEFIDAEGNLCDPKVAKSIRLRKIPIASKETTEITELRRQMSDLSAQFQNKEISGIKEEVAKLREDRGKKPEESDAIKTLKETLDAQKTLIEGLKTTIEDKDKKVLVDKISDLDKKIVSLASRDTSEWHTDEMRAISGGIHDLTTLVERVMDKGRPIDRIERLILGPGAAPVAASPEARNEVVEELRKQNLTVPR